MKKKLPAIIITAALILSVSLGVSASTGDVTATLSYNNIKVTLNGSPVDLRGSEGESVEPFIIDGTTYLPVRAVAGALGLDVDWDAATHTVVLTNTERETVAGPILTPTPTRTPAPTSTPTPALALGYSRTNPAPIGVSQTFTYSSSARNYTATVTIDSIERGSSAWTKIKNANRFNSAPDEGMEYILAFVTVFLESSSGDEAVSFSDNSFDVYSSDNVEYKRKAVVEPDPKLTGNIFPGATNKGYSVFQVSKSDDHPKAVIGANYKGSGGAWFALYE